MKTINKRKVELSNLMKEFLKDEKFFLVHLIEENDIEEFDEVNECFILTNNTTNTTY
jgi:hypothetical protein